MDYLTLIILGIYLISKFIQGFIEGLRGIDNNQINNQQVDNREVENNTSQNLVNQPSNSNESYVKAMTQLAITQPGSNL